MTQTPAAKAAIAVVHEAMADAYYTANTELIMAHSSLAPLMEQIRGNVSIAALSMISAHARNALADQDDPEALRAEVVRFVSACEAATCHASGDAGDIRTIREIASMALTCALAEVTLSRAARNLEKIRTVEGIIDGMG